MKPSTATPQAGVCGARAAAVIHGDGSVRNHPGRGAGKGPRSRLGQGTLNPHTLNLES